MNKNIFIGGVYPSRLDSFYKEKGKDNFSSVVFNQAVVERMLENKQLDYVFGIGEVGHYPMFSKTFKMKDIDVDTNYKVVGYNNLVWYNVYSKSNRIFKKFKKAYSKDESFNIIVSEASIAYLRAASKIKRRNKGSKITLIVFDLPEYVEGTKKSGLYSFLKRRSYKKLEKLYKQVDSFVYLSEPMKEALKSDKPYFVFPGIVNLDTYKGLEKQPSSTIDIIYCGTISKQFDIDLLIESFLKTQRKDLRLIIAGGGAGLDYVKEISSKDERIIYKGILNRDEALQLQLDASYLINPRLPNHDFSQYSFPSKTMNYLLTMNPVVSYVTKAFPKDISELLIVPDGYEQDDLVKIFNNASKENKVNKDKVLSTLNRYTVDSFIRQLMELVKWK